MNKAIIIGRLGKEANFRNGGEQAACRFQLAVKETWKTSSDETKENTEWVNVVVYGPEAEKMKEVPKGTLVMAQGASRTGSYEKDGETFHYFDIRARKLAIIDEAEGKKQKELDQNEVILIGRLGQDPVTPKEGFTHFSLACNMYERGEEVTQWINVATFNGLSESAARYLKKGRLVYVEGRLRTRSYDKDGQTRYATGVVATKWQALDAKPKKEETAEVPDSSPDDYIAGEIPF